VAFLLTVVVLTVSIGIFACAAISTAAALCTLSTGLMIIASTFCATNVSTCVSCFVASSSAKTTFKVTSGALLFCHSHIPAVMYCMNPLWFPCIVIPITIFFGAAPAIPKHTTTINIIVAVVLILLFIYLPPHKS